MKFILNLQIFAHKKGGGSSKNGRDSQAKRLGMKYSVSVALKLRPYAASLIRMYSSPSIRGFKCVF